jgi:hypothetical protein
MGRLAVPLEIHSLLLFFAAHRRAAEPPNSDDSLSGFQLTARGLLPVGLIDSLGLHMFLQTTSFEEEEKKNQNIGPKNLTTGDWATKPLLDNSLFWAPGLV